jgi:hypothetical protein
MEITYIEPYKWPEKTQTNSLVNYIESELTNTGYDTRGVAENAKEIAQNNSAMLARLIDVLTENRTLSVFDIKKIVGNSDEIVKIDQ